MTSVRLGPDAIFHRYLTPRWSHMPLSGAGAAANGGRFNRPGVEALYLSASPATALAEYAQGLPITPPALLVAYRLDVAVIATFDAGEADWAGWDCDWRQMASVERRTPPSWRLGDAVIRDGCRGLLFPSLRDLGGTNLVLFAANFTAGDRLMVHDPDGRLPRDQSSWPD